MSSEADDASKKRRKPSCENVRTEFKQCVLESDCVRVNKKHPNDCVLQHDVPESCQNLRTLMFECKRSLLDNRARFRGRKGD
ncbi:cytochrome c oxidase assembly factor 5-like protein [Dinothrombium tinctorium]|uniref:Cytochrome c oxidase assembly factor 5 n=1 Tax=Dinothrombium tinctorium TaxID=1965070 RepID=A0A3S3NIZ8_9ACAR|nr:cytochrome c oxidase assembly factor 5-like protein [Dinothrombium tinctorium]